MFVDRVDATGIHFSSIKCLSRSNKPNLHSVSLWVHYASMQEAHRNQRSWKLFSSSHKQWTSPAFGKEWQFFRSLLTSGIWNFRWSSAFQGGVDLTYFHSFFFPISGEGPVIINGVISWATHFNLCSGNCSCSILCCYIGSWKSKGNVLCIYRTFSICLIFNCKPNKTYI